MNAIATILRKDITRYKWALLTLAVLAVLQVVLFGTSLGLEENKFITFLHFCISIIGGLLQFVLIVLVVQEETLTDPDAYWVTRPMPRVHILFAKIFFCIIFIAGLDALAELFILAMNDGLSRSLYAFGGIFVAFPYVLVQIFLSAQTRSLPRFLLLVVCLYIGIILLAFAAPLFVFNGADLGMLNRDMPSHHAALIQTVYCLLAGTGVLAFLYQRRSIVKSWLLVILVIIGGLILTRSNTGIISYSNTGGISFVAELSKNELVSTRTHSVSGVKYRDYSGIIEVDGVPEGANVWVSVSYVDLISMGEEIEIDTFDYIQLLDNPIIKGAKHIYEVDLFSIQDSNLSKINAPVDLEMSLNLTVATQVEYSRIPLKTGNGLVHNGNRLLISSYYDTDDELSVRVAAYIFNFNLEPTPIKSHREPLDGIYSFGLYNPISDKTYLARVDKSWDVFNITQSASANFFYSDEQSIESLELIFYTRKVLGTSYEHISAGGVVIKK